MYFLLALYIHDFFFKSHGYHVLREKDVFLKKGVFLRRIPFFLKTKIGGVF